MIEAVVEIGIEVGDREHLDEETLREMKLAPAMAHAAHPEASIAILVGGFDRDPRPLWEIPEAAEYVRRFAAAAGLDDWSTDLFKALCQDTIAMLVKCDAVREPHPFTVVIE